MKSNEAFPERRLVELTFDGGRLLAADHEHTDPRAIETNIASYCEGARKIPRSSILLKNAAKRRVSHFFAAA